MMGITKFVGLAAIATATSVGAQATVKSHSAASVAPKSIAQQAAKPGAPATRKVSYKRELPDSLVRLAKVTEPTAAATALGQVPKGRIQTVELEREGGRLIYSYDIKVSGKAGIEEVQIDALTGAVSSNVHETPAMEKQEAAADAKEAKAKKDAAKSMAKPTKKPPMS